MKCSCQLATYASEETCFYCGKTYNKLISIDYNGLIIRIKKISNTSKLNQTKIN